MKLSSLLIFVLMAITLRVEANPGFSQWVKELKKELRDIHHFSQNTIDEAFEGIKYNEKVIRLDRWQPEFVKSTGSYLNLVISEARIAKGRDKRATLSELFDEIYSRYPVQNRFLLSFWALETNFSGNTGNLDIIESLTTLAYDGRRGAFFKKELINALKVLEMKHFHIPGDRLLGSWAGHEAVFHFEALKYYGFINAV